MKYHSLPESMDIRSRYIWLQSYNCFLNRNFWSILVKMALMSLIHKYFVKYLHRKTAREIIFRGIPQHSEKYWVFGASERIKKSKTIFCSRDVKTAAIPDAPKLLHRGAYSNCHYIILFRVTENKEPFQRHNLNYDNVSNLQHFPIFGISMKLSELSMSISLFFINFFQQVSLFEVKACLTNDSYFHKRLL